MLGGGQTRDAVINVTTTAGDRLLASGEDIRDATKVGARLQRQHRHLRLILCTLLLADTVASIVLVGLAYDFHLLDLFRPKYTLDASLVDCLALTIARLVAMSTQSHVGWWVGLLSVILAVCKAIVYSHTTQPPAAVALVFVSVAFSLFELHACTRCMAKSACRRSFDEIQKEADGAGVSLDSDKYSPKVRALVQPRTSSLRGTWKILRPYFVPTGLISKLRTAATFLVMGGSKACNLMAPIYIGNAAQTLTDGKVPYVELATYCALRFGSSALKEVHSLVCMHACTCMHTYTYETGWVAGAPEVQGPGPRLRTSEAARLRRAKPSA